MRTTKNKQALDNQIAEVRRMLEGIITPDPRAWLSFDRRIGYALSTKGVTRSVDGGSWGSVQHYSFVVTPEDKLTPTARKWIEANGMKDLADAFDAKQVARYVNKHVQELNSQRVKLAQQIATIDAKIAQYEAMLVLPASTESAST